MTPTELRLAVVAGEASGDALGAAVIKALRKRCNNLHIEGIGGPKMIAAGCDSLFPMERLAVMGLVEPLKRLPELLRIRRALTTRWQQHPPDLFLGIDAPDFNLTLEQHLRTPGTPTLTGTPTAHLVSPSVWAWRKGRVRKILRAVDRMMCLFPFETKFYGEQGVPCSFVGHPLADLPHEHWHAQPARKGLGLTDGKVVALLPGSRASEVRLLGPLFLEVAQRLWQADPSLRFLLPAANDERHAQLRQQLAEFPGLPVDLLDANADQALAAADAVLVASGTATLEAALAGCPMVIAYRLSAVNWFVLSRMVGVPFVGLPNLLAGREVVPEFLQGEATPEALVAALRPLLYDAQAGARMTADLVGLRDRLRQDCAARVADVLLELVEQR